MNRGATALALLVATSAMARPPHPVPREPVLRTERTASDTGTPTNGKLSFTTDNAEMGGETIQSVGTPSATPTLSGSLALKPDVTLDAVEATLACPTAQSVERRLASLRPADAAALWYRVDVRRRGDAFTLKAVTAEGDTFLERSLPAAGPCEELEQAAAAVLFAWEAQLPPGDVPRPVVLEKHELVEPASSPIPDRLRVSASGGAWLSAVAPGAGGAVGLEWRPTRLPIAVAFDVFGQGQRTVDLGNGSGTWSRLTFALGVTGTLSLGEQVGLTFGVSAVGGLFAVNGNGFQPNNSVLDWDAGLMGRARLMLPGLWHIRPFVGVDVVGWLRRHQIEVTGIVASAPRALPDVEVAPGLGLAWTL